MMADFLINRVPERDAAPEGVLILLHPLLHQIEYVDKNPEHPVSHAGTYYAIHNLAASLSTETWAVTLYANNLTDTYAETAARDTINFAQTVSNIDGDPVNVRRYYKNVLPPRSVGLRFTYNFSDLL